MNTTASSSLLLLAILIAGTVAITPSVIAASKGPCFYFTENGTKIGTTHCNVDANDLEVAFKQVTGTTCTIQFSYVTGKLSASAPCPKGANDIEVFWGPSSASSTPVITKCEWTLNGKPMTASCSVPKSAPVNDFTLKSHTVTSAYFTLNGKKIGTVVKAPTGANDLELTT